MDQILASPCWFLPKLSALFLVRLAAKIEELILEIDALAPQFHCILDRPGRLDTLTVRVESRPGAAVDQRDTASHHLVRLVKNRIGVSVRVDVVEPRSVERSVGKAKRLIDNRPQQ